MKFLKRSRLPMLLRPWLVLFAACCPSIIHANDYLDTQSELPSRYGYLVVDTVIGRPTTNWQLSNNLELERLSLGKQTILVRLPVGDYHWESIEFPYFGLPHRVDLADDSRWSFTIKKQKINYVGTLIVDESRGSDRVSARFVNRSSGIVSKLEEHFPDHLHLYGITFSGNYRDDYFALSGIDVDRASVE